MISRNKVVIGPSICATHSVWLNALALQGALIFALISESGVVGSTL